MSKPVEESAEPVRTIPLRDPVFAAILAWLVPGAGHFYQGRKTKGLLFFVCILSTFGYGLWLGGGRVVYAQWGPTAEDKRMPYFCQLGAGVAALPALYQAVRFRNEGLVDAVEQRAIQREPRFWDWFMAPPRGPELDELNYAYNRRFELGTVYTMIAGLLNLLVIFDAGGGPALGAGTPRPGAGPRTAPG